jgi:hypothetical protein
MKQLIAVIALLLPLAAYGVEEKAAEKKDNGKKYELTMSLNDRFIVADTEQWSVAIEKVLPLRFADVRVSPNKASTFSLMLYFKCDTPDLAIFNSPEKIRRSVRSSSGKYLPHVVEKEIALKDLNPKGWYGCYTVLTDAELAGKPEIPKGQFKYMTRGMVRLSPDSALGFSLMTNELDSPQYKELFDYILSFVKPKEKLKEIPKEKPDAAS